jgi:hypothetical protein
MAGSLNMHVHHFLLEVFLDQEGAGFERVSILILNATNPTSPIELSKSSSQLLES